MASTRLVTDKLLIELLENDLCVATYLVARCTENEIAGYQLNRRQKAMFVIQINSLGKMCV